VRYWDSSALVPLFVEQPSTSAVRRLHADDPVVLTWTLSEVEILSALARLEREGAFGPGGFHAAASRLGDLWMRIDAVAAVDAVKQRARRLLRTHPLRAADALQLGAALLAASDEPARWSFVCLDDALSAAARREGFAVLP
jgi:hypothetical protein